ncbi:MAG: hypothetical protein ACREYF_17040 [Gammaproteobacteria bacterium]
MKNNYYHHAQIDTRQGMSLNRGSITFVNVPPKPKEFLPGQRHEAQIVELRVFLPAAATVVGECDDGDDRDSGDKKTLGSVAMYRRHIRKARINSDFLLTWSMLYLGNVQKALGITHGYIEMVTKPQSELTHLIERQLHQIAKGIHEIEKDVNKLGEAGG